VRCFKAELIVYINENYTQCVELIFKEIESQLSIAPIDIEIVIKEEASHQWGFRGITADKANDLKYKVNL